MSEPTDKKSPRGSSKKEEKSHSSSSSSRSHKSDKSKSDKSHSDKSHSDKTHSDKSHSEKSHSDKSDKSHSEKSSSSQPDKSEKVEKTEPEKTTSTTSTTSTSTSTTSTPTAPDAAKLDKQAIAAEISEKSLRKPPRQPPPVSTKVTWDGFAGPFGDVFPQDIYVEFSKILGLARELNTQVAIPEIVIIGGANSGKSSFLESLLGHQITYIEKSWNTKRPLFLSLINNQDCSIPKIIIKRDSVLEDFPHDMEVTIAELQQEIEKRNSLSDVPIYVQYEYKNCWNLTIIDTPGLNPESSDADEIQKNVIDLIQPSTRFIVAVEEANNWDKMKMMEFVKKVDQRLNRTIFGYTEFQGYLKGLNTSSDVNRYISQCPAERGFFLTQIPGMIRPKYYEPRNYLEHLALVQNDDLRGLETLQYDTRFQGKIGVLSMKKYLLELIWKRYQETIPEILKRLRDFKSQTEDQLKNIHKKFSLLENYKLRATASNYVMNFLQDIEKLITGTLEGYPAQNGQTLDEEKYHEDTGNWLDSNNRPIRFNPQEWSIPYWDSKLYGGQQFERLLAEFKAVADHTNLTEVNIHEVATAAGPNKFNNPNNYAWAASDIAQKRSQKSFNPLIKQLFRRSLFIMKRLVDIADFMMKNREKEQKAQNFSQALEGNLANIEDFPFFTNYVKHLYIRFVEEVAANALSKCMDEFYCTRIIYWELVKFAGEGLPANERDTKKLVEVLAKRLFLDIRQRITKNVLLKCYNFFLVPLQTELWGETQGKVTALSDEQIEELFEVQATKQKYQQEEERLKVELKTLKEQEALFLEASINFSHPQ